MTDQTIAKPVDPIVTDTGFKRGSPEDFAVRVCGAADEIGPVGKDSHNEKQNYDYTSAAAVQSRVRKIIAKWLLFVKSATSELVSEGVYESRGGGNSFRTKLRVRIIITDGFGNEVLGEGVGTGADSLDKDAMKAQTAAYKYALCAAFCIPMGDDPEEVRKEAEEKAERQRQSRAQGAPQGQQRQGQARPQQQRQQPAPRPQPVAAFTGPSNGEAKSEAPPGQPAPTGEIDPKFRLVCAGRRKGTPLKDLNLEDLEWYLKNVQNMRNVPKPHLDAVTEELADRYEAERKAKAEPTPDETQSRIEYDAKPPSARGGKK